MLTSDAYNDRKWRDFPILRHTLEDKRRPRDDGPSCLVDTTDDRVVRLFDIASLTLAFRADVRDVARSEQERSEVREEVQRLADQLAGIADMFNDLSMHVSDLHGVIDQPERPNPDKGDRTRDELEDQ